MDSTSAASVHRPRRHRTKDATDPLWRISLERLDAAIGDRPEHLVARGAGIQPSTLNSLTSGRTRRIHWHVIKRLAVELEVPPDWLTGGMQVLPGVRTRWKDQLLGLRGPVMALRAQLAAQSERPTARRRWLSEGAALSGFVDGILSMIQGEHIFPPRVGDAEGVAVKNLVSVLSRLENVMARRAPGRKETAEALAAIEALLAEPVDMRPAPARAQLAEYRLRNRCVRAWASETAAAYPDFVLPDVEGVPEELKRRPLSTLGAVMTLIEHWLMPELWRGRFLSGATVGAGAPGDWDATAVALAQSLAEILRPWLDGEEPLREEGITALVGWLREKSP